MPVLAPLTFRGGVASGVISASWPLGKLTVSDDRIRISSSVGFRSVDLTRGQIEEILIRRPRLCGCQVEVKGAGGVVPKTVFLPVNPGKVALALEEMGWPVRVDLRRPGNRPTILLVLGLILIGLGLGEAAVKSSQADTIRERSVRLMSRIDSIEERDGKRHGRVPYTVASEAYSRELVLSRDRRVGDEVIIRYDPETPSRSWEQGGDPPGTDDWIFGPFGVLPGFLLLFFAMRQRGIKRFFDTRPSL